MSFTNLTPATPEVLAAIDRLIKPPEPPERIYGWLDTQMSLARYSGGLTYMGHSYYVVPTEPGAPLVRADVLEREAKEEKARCKVASKVATELATKAQGELL